MLIVLTLIGIELHLITLRTNTHTYTECSILNNGLKFFETKTFIEK